MRTPLTCCIKHTSTCLLRLMVAPPGACGWKCGSIRVYECCQPSLRYTGSLHYTKCPQHLALTTSIYLVRQTLNPAAPCARTETELVAPHLSLPRVLTRNKYLVVRFLRTVESEVDSKRLSCKRCTELDMTSHANRQLL